MNMDGLSKGSSFSVSLVGGLLQTQLRCGLAHLKGSLYKENVS